jgi:peptidoglycan/xylan/chitin deacetylase (PgdA/CDA1 family)
MGKILALLILLAGLAVFVYIVIPHLVKLLLRKKSLKSFGMGDSVYLTFDDGPDARATENILDILQEHEATAMFFITGEHARRHPECVKRILDGGNIVGEHGYHHIHPWKSGPIKTIRDFVKGRAIFREIEQQLHCNIKYYRPPYGKYNILSLILYLLYKKIPVFWHIDPKDYSAESPDKIVQHIRSTMSAGKVILLHDGRYGKNNPASTTVEAVRSLLSESSALHLKFTVDRYK